MSFEATGARAVREETRFAHGSAQILGDQRADPTVDPQRQTLPKIDEKAVAWVQRVEVRRGVAVDKKILVVKRLRLETPVLLEPVRSCPALAAPVVKDPDATFGGPAH